MNTSLKTTWSRFWTATLALGILAFRTDTRAADGDVDPSFNPPEQIRIPQWGLKVIGTTLYRNLGSASVTRLLDDGRPDPLWQLQSPSNDEIQDLAQTPTGQWVVMDELQRCYVETPDGSYQQLSTGSGRPGIGLFPQLDGSIVIAGRIQAGPDGAARPAFAQFRTILAAPFDDRPRIIQSVAATAAVQDTEGRFIVVGNFREAGGQPRLGLVRHLRDGRPDPTWNPAQALGITLNPANQISHFPDRVVLGPSNSVWVHLRVANPGGSATNRLARIAADGSVLASVHSHTEELINMIPQPDGKLIVGNRTGSWGDSPARGVVRLLANGELDPSFRVELGGTQPEISALAADRNGRLWISGSFDTVNGAAQPGFVRVFAWTPEPSAPQWVATHSPRRIGTNETFYLGAQIDGIPEPNLQWFLDDVPIPGATGPGLRQMIQDGSLQREYRLLAWNSSGTNEFRFPPVQTSTRSPILGQRPPVYDRPRTEFSGVSQLVPLADGRVLIASGRWSEPTETGPRLGRLTAEGTLDHSFGDQGIVNGRGVVEGMVPLPDGGVLVFGELTAMAGQPVSGIAQLDSQGRWVDRPFPSLDVAHISAALPLPDGGLILAGRFTQVGSVAAFRLVRLDRDLKPDASFHSPLKPWQFVDDLALDLQGRVLIAGGRIYTDVVLTNPEPTGLQRLLPNGSPDPAFVRYSGDVRAVFVEPEGTLLAGMPGQRLSTDGLPLNSFVRPDSNPGTDATRRSQPDHRMVRLPTGGMVVPVEVLSGRENGILVRWNADGTRDWNFEWTYAPTHSIQAIAGLPDGGLMLALQGTFAATTPEQLEASLRLIRIAPDPDSTLSQPKIQETRFRATLPTQPGVTYEVWSRSRLDGEDAELADRLEGDGYVQGVDVPADGESLFLELRRR